MQKVFAAALGTANINLDGTGTIVDVYIAPAAGGVVVERSAILRVTSTAGRVAWMIHRGGAGGWQLDAVMPIEARTVSASVPPVQVTEECRVPLQAGQKYGALIYAAEAAIAKVIAEEPSA